jgi:hypothetical protein
LVGAVAEEATHILGAVGVAVAEEDPHLAPINQGLSSPYPGAAAVNATSLAGHTRARSPETTTDEFEISNQQKTK